MIDTEESWESLDIRMLRTMPKPTQSENVGQEHGTITIRVRVGMPLRDAQHFARACYKEMLKAVSESALRAGTPYMEATWHPDYEHKVDLLS